jgi:thioredoxin-dependent peroxiredoxin
MANNSKAVMVSVLLGFAVLAMALGGIISYAADPPAVGAMAPAFKLNSQEGKPVTLADFKGKWIVLYFYPKDFTNGCTIEARGFQRDIAQYEKINAVIVGVSVDTTGSHADFCAAEGLSFKLLADDQKQVVPLYGSLNTTGVAIRNTFIVNPQGRIAKIFLNVQPTPHSTEVLAALAELQKK